MYMKQHDFPLLKHSTCSPSLDLEQNICNRHTKLSVSKDREKPRSLQACVSHHISIEANSFSAAMKYRRRRMHYAVDKHSEKQLQRDSTFQICTQIRTELSLSPVPLWRTGRSHCSCCSMSQRNMVSTMPNPREAGQQDLLVYAAMVWCLFYLLGVRKSAIAGCEWKCILLHQHSLEDLLYSPINIS